MREIKAYQCEHCYRKHYLTKKSAEKHEKTCVFRIDQRACPTCEHDQNRVCEDGMLRLQCLKGFRPEKVMIIRNCFAWEKKFDPEGDEE